MQPRNLTGHAYLNAVTDLLQRSRLEDMDAGLYEAADLQWWWRTQDASHADRQRFWFDAEGRSVACWLRFDGGEAWNHEFLWLPSARQGAMAKIFPTVLAAMLASDRPVNFSVRADDAPLRALLEGAGFAVDSSQSMVQTELTHDPTPTPLPPGFDLTTRVDDTRPHHMIKRNGAEVEAKLRECSLYRPDLDLCVRDAQGQVAAYILFWMDAVTGVGLVEPVRTEREFQRRGLARHLLAEGIGRLRALGAQRIRLWYGLGNEAAANLYHQAGFVDGVQALVYRLTI
jgi:predicted N-acetyltransferase YhbS